MRSPLTPPRTPSARVSSWVRVSARGETHGKNRERQPQDRRGLVDDTDLLKVVIFVCASDASYETPLGLDTVKGRKRLAITLVPAEES